MEALNNIYGIFRVTHQPFGQVEQFLGRRLTALTSRTCLTTASDAPNKSTPVRPRTSVSTAPGERFFFLRPGTDNPCTNTGATNQSQETWQDQWKRTRGGEVGTRSMLLSHLIRTSFRMRWLHLPPRKKKLWKVVKHTAHTVGLLTTSDAIWIPSTNNVLQFSHPKKSNSTRFYRSLIKASN